MNLKVFKVKSAVSANQSTDGLAAMTLAFQANNSGSNPDRCIIEILEKTLNKNNSYNYEQGMTMHGFRISGKEKP